jgi:DNA-binding winged helix-turn-helix (wHTH) protein
MNFSSDTNVLDVHVRRLRAKVDDPFPTKLIRTVRGVGYVLDDPAAPISEPRNGANGGSAASAGNSSTSDAGGIADA